jgi:MtN3 and saliva related transmembrane protein
VWALFRIFNSRSYKCSGNKCEWLPIHYLRDPTDPVYTGGCNFYIVVYNSFVYLGLSQSKRCKPVDNEYFRYIVELMFGLGMFINAMLFVPQAIKVYRTQNAKSLSKIMFLGFNAIQIFTILHGYINGDYALMFGSILTFFTSGIITFLIFLYK